MPRARSNPRKPGGGRPRIDWDQAFAVFCEDTTMSFEEVGRRLGVSGNSVGKHAKAGEWEAKRTALFTRARERADEKTVRTRAERIADTIELVDDVRQKLLTDVKAGKADVRLGDLAPLVKLEALLEGEATDRIDLAEVQALLREFYASARAIMTGEQFDKFVASTDKLGEAA